ncbi:sodium-dependent nutrient amino acid transporter 1-like isoform X2 [Penaeus chinensis]|uniref:sodium-dependent nutrient amino acid transporter 1-like isoform X2 n=1 Tax=Penaeus chinensis TaxID=139456 RepID=UPI001FB840D2|nr:sodium-dependent nutrient amino acid transporter 1-like isoform X2 [Penaeus chinensis]
MEMINGKAKGTINPGFEGDEKKSKDEGKVEVDLAANTEASEEPSRDQWSNPIEFLLSCIAMSVGLGNVWRFPFVALENGGGAFLIPYILVLLFIGKPLYYMELCLGQFASSGSVRVWDLAPAFRGVGYGQAVATWAVVTYYVSLMALTVFYFFGSFSSVLPWSVCPPDVQLDCVSKDDNVTALGLNVSTVVSSADEYFKNEVLQSDPNGLDNGIDAPEWRLSLCLLFSWIVLFVILAKGVQGSGKVAYFTALFPYLVLFIMLIRGATLPGSLDGIMFFITPRWEKLLDPGVWYAAVNQSFFSLSVGFGSIIMFSSYNSFRHNVYRDAAIISVTDTLTSLLAGFTTFAILGHLAHLLGIPLKDVVKSDGTSLAFISYPEVLSRFDWAPQLFAVLFFLMLFTLGVGSASALTGCIITIICDEFPSLKRWIVTLAVCVCGFLLGLFYVTPQGQYILTLIDYYGAGFIIFILAITEVAAVQWVYGINNFCRDVEFMLNRKTGIYWKFCWAFLIPVLLAFIFIYGQYKAEPLKASGYVFGSGANAFGVCIAIFACLLIPIFFVVEVMRRRDEADSLLEAMRNTLKPNADWCPKDPILRREYQQFKASHEKPELQGIDNPLPPVASSLSLASQNTTGYAAPVTQYNTSV